MRAAVLPGSSSTQQQALQQQQQSGLRGCAHIASSRPRSRRVAAAVAHFAQLSLPLQQPQQPCRSVISITSSHRTNKQQQQQQQHHHPRRGSTTVCSAAAGDAGEASSRLSAALASLAAGADAAYRFTRPHTMLGTLVSIVSVSLLAMQSFAWSGPAVVGLAQALLPALLMNVAIVGINQIYDVEIDKVNKPYLPLASGELSMQQGVAIVVVSAALSLTIGVWVGSPALLATLVGSLVLGVLYSIELPFMRWKRSPWLAALCILAVRAVMVQLGFFLHMQHALGLSSSSSAAVAAAASTSSSVGLTGLSGLLGSVVVTRPLAFTIAFMLLFSVVIALFKDLPDIKGDTQAGVRTFSVRHGAAAVFNACTALLLAAYACGVAFAATSPEPWSRAPVALGHMGLAALLWGRARRVNPARKQDLTDHYMFVWKLFYAEYLIIPFLR